jgi:hypothetical protein
MPRKKKPTVERFTFAQPLSALFSDQVTFDKLRADLFATTDKLENQLVALRNSIPVASDSDARNVLHQLVVDLEDRIDSVRNHLDIILSRRIKAYKSIREDKRLKRQAAQAAAPISSPSTAHAKKKVRRARE